MIIANGTIKFKQKSGGGIDTATGYPIAPTVTWSAAVQCQYVPTTQNLQATSNGEPVIVKGYEIYLEGCNDCTCSVGEVIELHDALDHTIGEYPVVSITPLVAVDQTRINV